MSDIGWRVLAACVFVVGAVVVRVWASDDTLAGALAGSAATIIVTTAAQKGAKPNE